MKKRLISLLLAAFFIYSSAPTASAAKPGSAAGYYYYTDIGTFLWNIPVNSINIGGRTLIDAESMAHYGFMVTWHPDQRWLELVDDGGQLTDSAANSGALLDMASGKTGKIAGKYYYTDIVTTMNGKNIESYNIGGRTFIAAENMIDYGYAVYWSGETRQLLISNPWADESVIKGRWGLSLYSGAETGEEKEINYFYMNAERSEPANGDFYSIHGSGFDALSGVTLQRNQLGQIMLSFSFYQNTSTKPNSLFYSKLRAVVSYRYDLMGYETRPELVYEALNALMQIYVNGERVMISELQQSHGNNHVDYMLKLDSGADLRKENVYTVSLLCNVPEDVDVTLPPVTAGLAPYEYVVKSIKENFGYTTKWEHETAAGMLIYGAQDTMHGGVPSLWLVNKSDGTAKNLITQTGLASYYGNHPTLVDLSVSADETTLYFSCDAGGKTVHFQADLITGVVSQAG